MYAVLGTKYKVWIRTQMVLMKILDTNYLLLATNKVPGTKDKVVIHIRTRIL